MHGTITKILPVEINGLTVVYADVREGEEVIVTVTCGSSLGLALFLGELMPDTLDQTLQRNLARRHKSKEWPYGSSLSPLKVSVLQAASRDSFLKFGSAFDCIHRQTSRYLGELEGMVRECKSVQEANNFSRWLQLSGVLELLELCSEFNPDFLTLRSRVKELISACGEHFKGGKVDVKYAESDIAEINRKLDFLMSQGARPVSPSPLLLESPKS